MRYAKIIDSFFNDVMVGKRYELLNKTGHWIVTDIGVEYNLAGSYNQENLVIGYVIEEE